MHQINKAKKLTDDDEGPSIKLNFGSNKIKKNNNDNNKSPLKQYQNKRDKI